MLSPVRKAFIAGLKVGYEFNVAQFISQRISDRAAGDEKIILTFKYLLMQIFLKGGARTFRY